MLHVKKIEKAHCQATFYQSFQLISLASNSIGLTISLIQLDTMTYLKKEYSYLFGNKNMSF
jgi:hypothetical protein